MDLYYLSYISHSELYFSYLKPDPPMNPSTWEVASVGNFWSNVVFFPKVQEILLVVAAVTSQPTSSTETYILDLSLEKPLPSITICCPSGNPVFGVTD